MKKTVRFIIVASLLLMVVGLAHAYRPITKVNLPPKDQVLYLRSQLNPQGPIEPEPLPPVKNPPITVTPFSVSPQSSGAPVGSRPGAPIEIGKPTNGGGAIPGGFSVGAADPVGDAERQMRRMIRRLEG